MCVLWDTLRLLEFRNQVCFLIEPDFQYQGSTVGFQILLWELQVVPLAEGEAGAKGSLREKNKLIYLQKKEPRKQEQHESSCTDKHGQRRAFGLTCSCSCRGSVPGPG